VPIWLDLFKRSLDFTNITIKLTPPKAFLHNLPPKTNFISLAPRGYHNFRMLHSTGINSFIPREEHTIAIIMKALILNNTASIAIDFPLHSRIFGQIGS
jgi:hypothetical protein